MNAAALFVGINAYKSAPLAGCVPDIRAMYELMTRDRGVRPRACQVYLDRAATRANILKGLQWLGTTGTEVLFFFYSGHGTRVLDVDGDEDGTPFDQAICPVDYEKSGLILDDDIAMIFSTFSPESRVVMHLDSCYSAGSERGVIGRWFSMLRRRRQARGLKAGMISDRVRELTYKERQRFGFLPPKEITLISGCRDFEVAEEAFLGHEYRGAMSYFTERAMRSLGSAASYRQVIDHVRGDLIQHGFPQIPQLTGRAEWLDKPAYT